MNKEIGARIKLYRREKFLSQQALADKLGISNAALSKIENGLTDLSVTRLNQIAQTLGVPASQLLDGSQPGMSDQAKNLYERSILSLKDDTILLQRKIIQLHEQLKQKA